MQRPDGLPVRYLGGFASAPAKQFTSDAWILTGWPHGLHVHQGSQKGRLNYKYWLVRAELWENLLAVSIDSGDRTRANIPAIAAFGVLGLAARRGPGTYITISYSDGDVFFFADKPAHMLRTEFVRMLGDNPEAASRIIVDGMPLMPPPVPSQVPAPVELVSAGSASVAPMTRRVIASPRRGGEVIEFVPAAPAVPEPPALPAAPSRPPLEQVLADIAREARERPFLRLGEGLPTNLPRRHVAWAAGYDIRTEPIEWQMLLDEGVITQDQLVLLRANDDIERVRPVHPELAAMYENYEIPLHTPSPYDLPKEHQSPEYAHSIFARDLLLKTLDGQVSPEDYCAVANESFLRFAEGHAPDEFAAIQAGEMQLPYTLEAIYASLDAQTK